MIYLDSSVALAALLAEDHRPPESFWAQRLFASRLLVYEVWHRLHARAAPELARKTAGVMLDAIFLIDLSDTVLQRAILPFPSLVKTLDGLHLATMDYLRSAGYELTLATYDQRLAAVALAMGFACWSGENI